jgi:hypothetical protein
MTVVGKLFLYGRIARPVESLETIQQRQAIVRDLASEELSDLFAELNQEFESLKKHEAHILGFEDSRISTMGRVERHFCAFGWEALDEYLNESSLAVSMYSTIETAKVMAGAAIKTASIVLLPLYSISLGGHLDDMTTNFAKRYTRRFAGISGPLYALADLCPNIIKRGMGILGSAMALLTVKKQYKQIVLDLKLTVVLHGKMLAVARYYRSARKVHSMLEKYPQLTQKLEHFHKLTDFLQNKELQPLFGMLDSRTFDSEAGIFFQRGNVFVPLGLLQKEEVRKEFRQGMVALAEIDSVLSTVKLLQEYTDERVGFCFPEFLEGKQFPEVVMNDYWHPIIGKEKAVTNSLSLGTAHNVPNVIITGPNAGGKSTTLRAIISIVLAQSIGIAPARSMQLTRFRNITSSMQTSDNVEKGHSLFQAQSIFMADLQKKMASESPESFRINVLDEIFTGTAAEDGSKLAKASARHLGTFPHSITMFATHFPNVTELEEEEARFVNYKVVAEMIDGMIVSPYTIEQGISNQRFGFAIAAQNGVNQAVIDEARSAFVD